jgi:hypothetical protein
MNATDMENLAHSLIGLTYESAREKSKAWEIEDCYVRIVRKDGQAYCVTRDYKPTRINITVEKNIVVSYTLG